MSSPLVIHFKMTGEFFDVPYEPQWTVLDLLTYVCAKTITTSNINPDDYYLALGNTRVLENSETVNKSFLDTPERFGSLQMCMKTHVLMRRIHQAREQFWQSAGTASRGRTNADTNRITNSESDSFPSTPTCRHASDTAAAANIQTNTISAQVASDDVDLDEEIHLLVCGGPKVGKSTFINALCGRPVAKTNSRIGLNQCTRTVNCYQLNKIHFWDTPGIQQWSHLDVDSFVESSALRRPPLCMFYCAAPGSFAKLKQLDMLLDQCIRHRHIYCALIVTNMFANPNRQAILDEFKALLAKYVERGQSVREEQGVWYYGEVGLCAMVNSQEYVNDNGRLLSQQGVNELILGVIKSLNKQWQLRDWLHTIEHNRKFWIENQAELCRLAK